MPQLEFQEKSVKKAIAKASRQLNIDTAELDYKIISHGSTGIFGLVGSRKAKILVTLPESNENENTEEKPSLADETVAPATDEIDNGLNDTPEPIPVTDDKPTQSIDIKEAAEYGQTFLQQIVDAITSDTTITRNISKVKVTYKVTGGNSALLIGKHGQTLEALQFLTERAVNHQKSRRVIIEVDVAGYQAKRRGNLADQAKRMADKAHNNKRPVTIGPMSPQDRRTIHMTLKSDPRVRTQSAGQGAIRKLTIYPNKRNRRPARNR